MDDAGDINLFATDASSRTAAAAPRRKAVVIGGGFGGLALAVRLQSAGIATTLVEARDKLGGRAYVYEQDGFTFDAGPTVITDPSSLEELFALSGRQLSDYVTLLPVEPFYRLLWEDGRQFDYVNDQTALDREITAFNPDDVAGYQRFLAYSKAAFEEGYLKLGHVPFLDFKSMLMAAPKLAQMQAWRSVYDTVAGYIEDEHLRQAFSFHTLLVGGSPFAVSSIYALIHALERKWGVWFPKGGTGALVQGLARLFTDLGGEIRLSSPVDEITTRGMRATGVRLADGEVLEANLVASNADIVHTLRQAAPQPRPRPHRGDQPEGQALQHEPIRHLLRVAQDLRRPAAPHHPVRRELPRAGLRHLRGRAAAGRLLALPACADRHRPGPGRPKAAPASTCWRLCPT